MNDQNFSNDSYDEPVCLDELVKTQRYANALAIVEKRLRALQTASSGCEPSADILKAAKLVDEAKVALQELDRIFSELSSHFKRLSESRDQKNKQIIIILSGWLDNLRRMKTDAALHH